MWDRDFSFGPRTDDELLREWSLKIIKNLIINGSFFPHIKVSLQT